MDITFNAARFNVSVHCVVHHWLQVVMAVWWYGGSRCVFISLDLVHKMLFCRGSQKPQMMTMDDKLLIETLLKGHQESYDFGYKEFDSFRGKEVCMLRFITFVTYASSMSPQGKSWE